MRKTSRNIRWRSDLVNTKISKCQAVLEIEYIREVIRQSHKKQYPKIVSENNERRRYGCIRGENASLPVCAICSDMEL